MASDLTHDVLLTGATAVLSAPDLEQPARKPRAPSGARASASAQAGTQHLSTY